MTTSNWVKKRSLLVYFVLACAITWAFMIPAFVIAAQEGYTLPTPETLGDLVESGFQDGRHIAISIIGTFSAYGPVLAAIIVASLEGGKAGLREWWQRVTRWRVGVRGYRDWVLMLVGIFTPLVVIGLILGPLPTGRALVAPLVYLVPFILYEFLTSGMEEPGWRGYALPKLQSRYNSKKASLILGLVWGVWHWPAFIGTYFNALSDPATPAVAVAIQAAVQCVLYIGGSILAMSFIQTWLYNRTGSAWMCLLLHGGANSLGGYIQAVLPNPVLGMAYGVVRWGVAIVLMRFFWREPSEAPLAAFGEAVAR
jgi:uncharacterized protein